MELMSNPMWVEILVVCDKKYISFHQGKRDIEQWVLTTFSKVNGRIFLKCYFITRISIIFKVKAVFADGTLSAVVEPVIVRIIYLDKEEEEIDLDIQVDVDKTLNSFCNWAVKFQPKDESHPNHFDISILLSMYVKLLVFMCRVFISKFFTHLKIGKNIFFYET